MLAAALLLTGCATKPFDLGELNTTPVQGAIVPKYAPSSGVLVLGEGWASKGRYLPRARSRSSTPASPQATTCCGC